jgi:hypothetical protein
LLLQNGPISKYQPEVTIETAFQPIGPKLYPDYQVSSTVILFYLR